MRDPKLVFRAERAAIALERSWENWRAMHGFGADPLPAVSSYVGYSIEEPWGQPRVVFGVSAEDAERLASILDGHDCVGPVYAEVTGRRAVTSGPAAALDLAPAEGTAVPAASVAAASVPASVPAASVAAASVPAASVETALAVDTAAKIAPSEPSQAYGPGASPAAADPASTIQIPVPAMPGIVAFRRRADQVGQAQEPARPEVAQPLAASATTPSQGPGYQGPRYQGFPPQYQQVPDAEVQAVASMAGSADVGSAKPARPQPDLGRSPQVSKLGKSRRPGTATHDSGAWVPKGEPAATDTAV